MLKQTKWFRVVKVVPGNWYMDIQNGIRNKKEIKELINELNKFIGMKNVKK